MAGLVKTTAIFLLLAVAFMEIEGGGGCGGGGCGGCGGCDTSSRSSSEECCTGTCGGGGGRGSGSVGYSTGVTYSGIPTIDANIGGLSGSVSPSGGSVNLGSLGGGSVRLSRTVTTVQRTVKDNGCDDNTADEC